MCLFGNCSNNNNSNWWIWIFIIAIILFCSDGNILGSGNNCCCENPCLPQCDPCDNHC